MTNCIPDLELTKTLTLELTTPLREFDTFFHVATWSEWFNLSKSLLQIYIKPWLVSNLVGVLLLAASIRLPSISRKAWGLLLILASVVNTCTVLSDPVAYQEFGVLAIPPIQRFIYSRYFAKPARLVLPIALSQFFIGLELAFGNSQRLRKVALTGAMIFFVGIATLGVGSAFPSSLLYAMTMTQCWPPDLKSKGN